MKLTKREVELIIQLKKSSLEARDNLIHMNRREYSAYLHKQIESTSEAIDLLTRILNELDEIRLYFWCYLVRGKINK